MLCVPSWADNERTGDRWAIANKLASMELWLESHAGTRDDEAVLFLDPDMVFLEPVQKVKIDEYSLQGLTSRLNPRHLAYPLQGRR